jgi:hypothetical protein
MSAGLDNDFGLGGQFLADATANLALPFDSVANQTATTFLYDPSLTPRRREADNLTNFKNGRLQ